MTPIRRLLLPAVCAVPCACLLPGCATSTSTSISPQYATPAPPPSAQSVIRNIKSAIANEPLNWRAYNELGIAYYKQERYEEAIAAFEQALALHPIFKVVEGERTQQRVAQLQRQAAQQAQAQAQQQQASNAALSIMGQLLGSMAAMPGVDPNLINAATTGMNVGGALMQAAPAPGGALIDLPNMPQESAFQARQELGQIHANLGKALIGRKFFDKAAESLERSLEMDPSRVEHLRDLGVSYYRLARYEKAIATLNRFLALCPSSPDPNTFVWLSDAFAALGLNDVSAHAFNVAAKGFSALAAREPGNPRHLNSLGFAYMDHGKFGEAVEAYRKALAVDANQGLSLRRLGVCYYCLGRYQDAADALGRAVTVNVRDDASSLWLGRARAALGQRDELAACCGQIVSRHAGLTKFDRPPVPVAAAFAAVGKLDQAIPWLEAAAQENPSDRATAYTLYELGEAYASAGDPAKAMDAFDRALVLDPNALYSRAAIDRIASQTAGMAQSLLQSADAAASSGASNGVDKAVADYAEAVRLLPPGKTRNDTRLKLLRLVAGMPQPPALPSDAQNHLMRANAILKGSTGATDVDRAIMEYKTAMRDAPWDAGVYLNLAVGCALRQRYADAILNMRLYLTARPKAPDVESVLTRLHQLEYEREHTARSPATLTQLRYEQYYGDTGENPIPEGVRPAPGSGTPEARKESVGRQF